MKDYTLFVMKDNLLKQKKLLPKLEELITTYIPGKAMRTLDFLLFKASEVTVQFHSSLWEMGMIRFNRQSDQKRQVADNHKQLVWEEMIAPRTC